MRKLANIFAFYQSTLPVNLALSFLPLLWGGIDFFASVFLTFGYAASLFLKEFRNKNHYLFYYNNGISKMQLMLFAYGFNFLHLVVFVLVFRGIYTFFG